ncbi:hypothetical protein CU005_2140 [Enterococcus faecium]|uniref:hypothetical protein n=1 Tax=Enterococcus faecium TaxID=1352 RepID=UPI001E046F5A|nr:hypothetical protein [Enterococcus faecium]MBK4848884.1 hypothetical protein [Enterococcus faecium]MBK4870108.1 hypothetical protein [Enterococcus faecium]
MSEDQLIGIIYSQLLEEFGFGYSEKDFWMIAENIAEKIVNQIPQLNDNQKIVLEWLKLTASTGKPMQVVFWMMNNAAWGHIDKLRDPLMELTDKQQFQVLTAFAQWGLEQEEAE